MRTLDPKYWPPCVVSPDLFRRLCEMFPEHVIEICDDCEGQGSWYEAPYGKVTCGSCDGSGRAQVTWPTWIRDAWSEASREEQAKAQVFAELHACRSPALYCEVRRTGVGDKFTVRCAYCSEECDVSDYSSW